MVIMGRGRENMKVWEYSEDGKYLRNHESIAEFARLYNLDKNVTHRRVDLKDVFYEFEDGRVVSLKRIGRVGVALYKEYVRSPFVGTPKSHHSARGNGYMYEMYDLDGDIMAIFQSDWHLEILTGINVHSKFDRKDNDKPVKMENGIVIKRIDK
jgi:hypothetical protein